MITPFRNSWSINSRLLTSVMATYSLVSELCIPHDWILPEQVWGISLQHAIPIKDPWLPGCFHGAEPDPFLDIDFFGQWNWVLHLILLYYNNCWLIRRITHFSLHWLLQYKVECQLYSPLFTRPLHYPKWFYIPNIVLKRISYMQTCLHLFETTQFIKTNCMSPWLRSPICWVSDMLAWHAFKTGSILGLGDT